MNHRQKRRNWIPVIAVLLAVLWLAPGSLIAATEPITPIMLNNELLRFGNGFENSINASGNLQQPFYKNQGGAWQKLTFSSYPLDFQIQEGGDGTQWWNLNGSGVYNPSLTNQTFLYNDYVQTSSGGYGTISTKGTVVINGKLIEMETVYTLPQDKALISVTTTFKNLSDQPATNLRYWVGTRDDFVGNSDSNSKEKGNIVEGSFAPISNQNEPARALKVFNDSEGVIFYTNSDKANIIVGQSYGWSNVIYRNPVDTPITMFGDNSYAFYVRFDDLQPGQSETLNWYYAAGVIADLEDIISDIYDSVQASQTITNDSLSLEISYDEDATFYYVVVPSTDPQPTVNQIIAGSTAADGTPISSGSQPLLADTPTTVLIENLIPGTNYRVYSVIVPTASAEPALLRPIDFRTTNRRTITLDSNGGSDVEDITLEVGSEVVTPANPTREGYTFVGWEPALPDTMPDEGGSAVAQWDINDYNLTVDYVMADDSTAPEAYSQVHQYNSSYSVESPIVAGYTSEQEQVTGTMPASNQTFTVTYHPNEDTGYRVKHYTEDLDGRWTLNETETLTGTTNTTVQAVEKTIAGFTAPLSMPDGVIAPDGSLVLELYYSRNSYEITFETNGGSTVDKETFLYGELVTPPQTPTKDGYQLESWYEDQQLLAPFTFGSMPANDFTLYAKWVYNTVYRDQGGSVKVHTGSWFSKPYTLVMESIEPNSTNLDQLNRGIAIAIPGHELVALKEIHLEDENGPVTFDGTILFEVCWPLPIELQGRDDLKVVFVDDEGNMEVMDSWIDGDSIYFTTNHFSTYALAAPIPPVVDNPKTSRDGFKTPGIILLAGLGMTLFGFLKRKNATLED